MRFAEAEGKGFVRRQTLRRSTRLARLALLVVGVPWIFGSATSLAQDELPANIIVTSDAPSVERQGSFERFASPLSRSRAPLHAIGSGNHDVAFRADLPTPGYYRVFAWWPQVDSTAGDVAITVYGSTADTTVKLNQAVRAGQWVPIGIFAFGNSAQVVLSGATVVADAVRLQYMGQRMPALAFDTDTLPLAATGEQYEGWFDVIGGVGPYTFQTDAARLPPGLALDPNTGAITGVATVIGHYQFDVELFDRSGQRAVKTYVIDVAIGSGTDKSASRAKVGASVVAGQQSSDVTAKDGVAAGAPPNLSGLVGLISSLPEGEWVKANLNAFSDVWTPEDLRPLYGLGAPPPYKIILAWSSFAWDPNRGDLWLFGGGHANYPGNDVYRWRGSTRMWERASLPSEIEQDDLGNWQAVDGWDHAPASAHTYDNNMFFPHIDRFIAFGGAAFNSGAAWSREVTPTTSRLTGPFFFNPSLADGNKVGGSTGSHVMRVAPHPEIVGGNMWANRDMYVNIAGFPVVLSQVNGCTAYADENGKDVAYIAGRSGGSTNTNLYKYTVNSLSNPALDTFQTVGIFWSGTAGMTTCALDPVRNVLVRTGTNAIPFMYWSLATPGVANKDARIGVVDPTGEFASLLASNAIDMQNCAIDFDPQRSRFVLWCGDGRVWSFTPPTPIAPTGWTIVKQRSPTLATPNGDVGTGILGKWKYVPNLDAFIGLQDATLGNIWIYKPVGWIAPDSQAKTSTTTTLTASSNPAFVGNSVTFTASVSGGSPTGTVQFTADGTAPIGCSAVTLSSNHAACSTSSLGAGTHAIVARYAGDSANAASTSATLSEVVNVAPGGAVNVALAANGGVASASSTLRAVNAVGYVNDNQRSGAGWSTGGGGWADGTKGAFPDWVQINFNGQKTLDHVVVYSVQDNFQNPVEPTGTMTFSRYGLTAFQVQGWNGTSWVTLGSVSGNKLIERTVAFPAFTTDRIRVVVSGVADGTYSRITEIEAWTASAALTTANYALAANGGVATASSTLRAVNAVGYVNDNQRSGAGWSTGGGGWADATKGAFPDWVQINFNGQKTIDHVVVYSVQDNFQNPIEPTDTMTFLLYGLTAFQVQGWNGASWVTLGSVSGNSLIKRTVAFAAFTTDRIRVVVTGVADGTYSRITEIEAWGS